jgi:hypothetical protein
MSHKTRGFNVLNSIYVFFISNLLHLEGMLRVVSRV